MADEPSGLHEISIERPFPWVRLFHGWGVSIDAKKIILAVLGLIVFHLGREGLDRLFPSSVDRPALILKTRLVEPLDPPFSPDRGNFLASLHSASWRVTEPVRALVGPFVAVFAPVSGWRAFLHALLAAVWGVMVWGIIGGSIARMAVVQVVRTDRIGMGESLRFARGRWLSLVGTPLTPLLGVAFFASLCAAFGLLYWLPGSLGPAVAGIFTVFPLLAGLVMAIILVSLAVAWPLMHATVAAEGEDGFDALSRSFAYVHQRPGRYAAYVALAWALGIFGLIVVDLFARTTVHLAYWALSFGAPDAVLGTFFQWGGAQVAPSARGLHAFWFSVVGLVAHAWVYSYFWTSATIIYLILRQDVDGTPWHVIAAPERRPFEFAAGSEPTAEPSGATAADQATATNTSATAVASDTAAHP